MGKKSQNKTKNSKERILDKIENNFNSKFKIMEKILDKKKEYNLNFNTKKMTMDLFDNKKNKILTGNINFYGIIKTDGQFLWAYVIPGIDKRFINKINKIKSFSHLFENSDNEDMMLYYSILTQDRIQLNEKEMKKLYKLLLYLSEDLHYFVNPNSIGNLQLIFLSNIIEQYV